MSIPLSRPMGEQDHRQDWLLAGLRQRVACRCLRQTPHQVRRLRQALADTAVGFGDLRPPGR